MKRIVALIMILTILFSVGSMNSFAEDTDSAEAFFKDGLAYYEKGDYINAYPYFWISGDIKNYAPSQNMLGVCYRDGLGIAQNLKMAEKYFKLAAEQGDTDAETNLAELENEREKLYRDATALFFEEKYEEAKASFEMLGDFEFSKDFILKCEEALDESKNKTSTTKPKLNTNPNDLEIIQENISFRENNKELKEAAQIEIAEKRIVYDEVSGGGDDSGSSSGTRRGGSGGGGVYYVAG